jgi:hypothetical protein
VHVLDYDEQISWMETSRMRWRALGVPEYLKQLLTSVATYAISVALLLLVLGLYAHPFWHLEGLRMVLGGALFGCGLRLVIECIPAAVGISRHKFSCKRAKERYCRWSDCRNIRCGEVNGVLRLAMEIPKLRKPGAYEAMVIAAPVRYSKEIDWILKSSEAADSPSPLPAGLIPLDYVAKKYSPNERLAFGLGGVLLPLSVFTLGASLFFQFTGGAPVHLKYLVLPLLFSIITGIAGVFCLRSGMPWFREQHRLKEKSRMRKKAGQHGAESDQMRN